MTFPVTFAIGPLLVPAHLIFEAAAYVVGLLLIRRERGRVGDFVSKSDRWTLTISALFGAIVGSKLVHWSTEWPNLVALAEMNGPLVWLGGKSIVGGLIGGTLGVEIAKHRLGITRRTGDVYVLPLIAAILIGRIGCFLSGLEDHTHGSSTALPWAIDLGDGIGRHPTQIYEMLLLVGLALILVRRRPHGKEGALFDAFLLSYLLLRVGLDFIKPYPRILGLAGTQIWAVLGIVLRIWFLYGYRLQARMRVSRTKETT